MSQKKNMTGQGPEEAGNGAEDRLGRIAGPLLDWFYGAARPLPWREDPTPYRVWISEVMLQQTRIETVRPYFERFMKRLPDVRALADVSEDELLKLWQGLGYYSRARSLKRAAQLCVREHGGDLPGTARQLEQLPGIGPYTAAAIASIAFGEPVPTVDGNVLRVMSRLTNRADDVLTGPVRKRCAAQLAGVIPAAAPGAFNEAMMELGETVCLPGGAVRCGVCPLCEICAAREAGTAADLPVRSAPKERRVEEKTVLLLERAGRVAIRRRPDRGLLAGLYEFPSLDGRLSASETAAALGLPENALTSLGEARHLFSHIEWKMTGYRAALPQDGRTALPSLLSDPGLIWAAPAQLRDVYALPAAFRAFEKHVSAAP